MSNSIVDALFTKSSQVRKLGETITQSQKKIHISGLVGAATSLVIADTFKKLELPLLLIFNDKEEAAYHLNDLENILGDKEVLFYPGSYRRPYQIEETDNANVLLRSEVLNRINSRKKPAIIVTYPDALFEKVATRKELEKNTLKISVGDQLSIDFINEVLFEYQFHRTDFVTEPGEFSVRGGILDVFSFSNDKPYRIEFFGNEVESIRTFDVETQLSLEQVKKVLVIPNVDASTSLISRISFLKYIQANTVVFIKNPELLFNGIDTLFTKAIETFSSMGEGVKQLKPETLFTTSTLLKKELEDFTSVVLQKGNTDETIHFQTKPQPSFNKQFDLLIQNLNENTDKGYKNYIFCSNEQQSKRFKDIFNPDSNQDDIKVKQFETVVFPLHQG
ncbi:MAG: transcription-repair coupling factor, partial [Flavobacteriaceae bacterium CG_4_8_14_3_um_filter_34_10]